MSDDDNKQPPMPENPHVYIENAERDARVGMDILAALKEKNMSTEALKGRFAGEFEGNAEALETLLKRLASADYAIKIEDGTVSLTDTGKRRLATAASVERFVNSDGEGIER